MNRSGNSQIGGGSTYGVGSSNLYSNSMKVPKNTNSSSTASYGAYGIAKNKDKFVNSEDRVVSRLGVGRNEINPRSSTNQ